MKKRIKIIKDGKYKRGQTVTVDNKTALDLLEAGEGIISKDMVITDYKTKKRVREGLNG